MGISINPITIISRAFVRIIEVIFRHIKICRSSCCQSECNTRRNSQRSNDVNNNYISSIMV